MCVDIMKYVKMMGIRIGGAYGNRFFILHNVTKMQPIDNEQEENMHIVEDIKDKAR